MLTLPSSYQHALETVLRQKLDESSLRSASGKRFIEQVAAGVAKISGGLTRDREAFIAGRYLKDKGLRDAYLAYYTTTNLLKLWPPMRELAQSGFFGGRDTLRHLDIGSGTGAAVWGMASYLDAEQPGVKAHDVLATDLLGENLRIIEKLHTPFAYALQGLACSAETEVLDTASRFPASIRERTFDIITLMNVVNEVVESKDIELLENLKRSLSPDGAIVMIEPATRAESRRALRFRDRAVSESGLFVYAPCCKHGDCPALLHEGDWCHTDVGWQRPPFIEMIDALTGNLRLSLKSTYAIFRKEDKNLVEHTSHGVRDFMNVGRVVTDRFDEKGRTRFEICNVRGRKEYVRNRRDRTAANGEVAAIELYDLVSAAPVEEREHDVKLTGETVLHILSRADGCGYVDKKDR